MTDLSAARRFLANAVVWPENGEGYVNIHAKITKPDKPIWFGKACVSVDEAINSVQWMLNSSDPIDIFACTSLQSQCQEKTSKAGKLWKAAVRSQANAVSLRSFFIDVDIGKADSHATERDAIVKVAALIKLTGLPKPSYVVRSGGGMHLWWCMVDPMSRDDWQPYADGLADAGRQAGLLADYGCTVDAARILRVPGTLNRKQSTPRPVTLASEGLIYSNDRIIKSLEPFKSKPKAVFEIIPPGQQVARYQQNNGDELGTGVTTKAAAVDLQICRTECPFIDDALTTGGASYANPLWMLTTLISTFSEGGRADAHAMAFQHPGYSQESTDALFDRKVAEKQRLNLGWPSCQSIAQNGSPFCQGCKHFAAGKSPLHFQPKPLVVAKQALLAGVTQDDVPDGYVRMPAGHIGQLSVDESNGNELVIPLTNYPMLDPWLDDGEEPALHFYTHLGPTGRREVKLENSAVSGMTMRASLQRQHFMLPPGNKAVERMGGFMSSWIQKLQKAKEMVAKSTVGWQFRDGEYLGFVYDNKRYHPSGTTVVRAENDALAKIYRVSGSADAWPACWKLASGRPDMEALVATAFAAPLMHFLGHSGLTLSVYSTKSGIGKTTALSLANAVWGQPKAAALTLNTTYNAAMNKVGQLRNLPMAWDEIKSSDQFKKFTDVAFDMTLGVEKGRSRRDGSVKVGGDWQTLLSVCSNESLLGYITSNSGMNEAGVMRVFEYEALENPNAGRVSTAEAQRLIDALNYNHGHLGEKYAEYIGANYDAVKDQVDKVAKIIEKKFTAVQDERFWTALIAVILTGAKIAKDQNLVDFQMNKLRDFLFAKFEEQRQARMEAQVRISDKDTLSDLFATFWQTLVGRHVLWTDGMPSGPGRPQVTFTVTRDASKLDGVKAQVAEKSKMVRIAMSAVGDWCAQSKKVSRHSFVKHLTSVYGAKRTTACLGAGTQHKTSVQSILQIDLGAHPELDMFD